MNGEISEKIKIGWSEADITPQRRIKLSGQFYERISQYVESPLCVVGMAISDGSDHAVFCACDIESASSNLIKLARSKIEEINKSRGGNGPDPMKVIISATHSHTSYEYARDKSRDSTLDVLARMLPDTMKYESNIKPERDTDKEPVITEVEALEIIADGIAEAAVSAWHDMKEAMYIPAFGRAAVGMCRRVKYSDGTAKMWGDTDTASFDCLEGGNDSGVELLYTFDTDKNPTGVVVNISCPAQVLEQRSFVSSDYWGKVREYTREKFGSKFKVLGLCGAAGDQCPRDLVRWVEPETPIDDPNVIRISPKFRRADPSMFDIAGCRRVGRRIAREIINIYDEICSDPMCPDAAYKSSGELSHSVIMLDMPLRRVTPAEYEKAKRELEAYIEKTKTGGCPGIFTYKDNAAMHVCAGTVARYERQEHDDIHRAEIHVLRFSDMAFVTSPFELFLDYGNRIRARSAAAQTFIVQLCCGSDGYLPTEKAEQAGHYSAYVSSGVTGHEGGDLLVRKTLDEIRRKFCRQKNDEMLQ